MSIAANEKNPPRNPFDIDEENIKVLGQMIREIKPESKKNLTGLVENLYDDITIARKNGVSWDDIAMTISSSINTDILKNSLSQVYSNIKKRRETNGGNERTKQKNDRKLLKE